MDRDNQQEKLGLVRDVLAYLSRDIEKYFSVGRIYRYGKKKMWRPGDNSPGTISNLEQCLDELVRRDLAERVIADLGESTNSLKLYREKH